MSIALQQRLQAGATWVSERVSTSSHPLAEPPPGSGLLPVPGDHGAPILGRGIEYLYDTVGFTRRYYHRFGPVSWCGMFGTRGVLVIGPDAVDEVLTNRDKAFANGPGWEYFIGPFFRRGIMLLDGEEHLRHRRIMQHGFTRQQLETYLDVLNAGVERDISGWHSVDGLHLYDAIKQLLLNLATEVFVGGRLGREADELNRAFVDTVAAGLAVVRADVPGGGWSRGLRGRAVLERYFREQLPEKRAGGGVDLFSVLCHAETEDGAAFTDDDVVNHMIFLLMAAHDTSTITASMMAYYLAKFPDWQQRLRAEAQAVGRLRLGYADIDRLPLMDQVFKETLRLNPPVGSMARQAVKDTAILGHHVPAGTKVFVVPTATHRLDEYWPNPDHFDPGRFAEDRREDKSHRYAWVPFGGGVHKCIGMFFGGLQVKAILYQLLLNYSWSVTPAYEPPMVYGTGLYPADGLPVRLTLL